jgi:dihydrofolate synthase / folylpolyglutamate synthase
MRSLDELLSGRGLFGIRLGLERMALLLERLGHPERTFQTIHVVGTNGKTSTTLCAAAILNAHGLGAGAYVSPHVTGYAERVQAHGRPLDERVLVEAVERTEREAAAIDAAGGDPVTQFEVLTAAAFLALAGRTMDVVVVEAGLGGRYDATNVIDAPVVALTNVALDHVEQLGPTRDAIAAEKLAVLRKGATLVTGPLDPEIAGVVRQLAAGAGEIRSLPAEAAALPYRERNARLAELACEAFLGDRYDAAVGRAAADAVRVPGRLQVIGADPLTIVDGAHNPDGARALAGEIGDVTGTRRPLVGVLAILADKDVDGVCEALAPVLDRAVATRSTSSRALPESALAERLAAAGVPSEALLPPAAAVARARDLAGPAGAVLVCGSLSLLADLLGSGA